MSNEDQTNHELGRIRKLIEDMPNDVQEDVWARVLGSLLVIRGALLGGTWDEHGAMQHQMAKQMRSLLEDKETKQ